MITAGRKPRIGDEMSQDRGQWRIIVKEDKARHGL
jgi:hypothetical protein